MPLTGWRKWVTTVVLGLVILATFVIGGLSVNFVDDPFEHDALVLITSFAAGMTLLAGVALFALVQHGSRSAWIGLLAYPIFFVWHVIALGTYVPDAVLAVVAGIGLAVGWPRKQATLRR